MAPSKKSPYDEHVAFWKANRKKVIDLDTIPPREKGFILIKHYIDEGAKVRARPLKSVPFVISSQGAPVPASVLQNGLLVESYQAHRNKGPNTQYYFITGRGDICKIEITHTEKGSFGALYYDFRGPTVNLLLMHLAQKGKPHRNLYLSPAKKAKNSVAARKDYVRTMLSENNRGVLIDWGRRSKKTVSERDYVSSHDPKTGRDFIDPEKVGTLAKVRHGVMAEKSCDIEGIDVPMANIRSAKTKSGKVIRYGASSKSFLNQFPKSVLALLNAAFTNEELRKTTAYIEYGGGQNKGFAGNAWQYKNQSQQKTFSIIALSSKYKNNPEVIIHEFVHARRHAYGEHSRDRDREEAETDLETMGRLTENELLQSSCGYYQYLVSGDGSTEKRDRKIRQLQLEDRRLLTKKPNTRMKGVPLRKRIKEVFPKTHISLYARYGKRAARHGYACPAQAEWIDQYFQVVAPGGRKSELHIHFQKKEDPRRTRSRLIKEQVAKNGPKCKIYEWRDGKKVLIYPKEKLMIPTTKRRRVR